MRHISKGLVMLAAICLMALPRPAASTEGPCVADAKKLCPKADKETVGKCLKEHEAQLSDACKSEIAKAKAQAEVRKACAADVGKLCKDVQPGQGRVAACLGEHESELSAGCKAARSASRQARAAKMTSQGAAPAKSKAGSK